MATPAEDATDSVAGPEVLVVPTGVANVASVLAGLRRAGATARLAESPTEVAAASHAVLPGVGAFAAGMEQLEASGYGAAIAERVAANRRTLAVCLGLQLLCDASEEDPGVAGLGLFAARLERFAGLDPEGVALRVPQLGWNRIAPEAGCRFLEPGHVYFANSFRLPEAAAHTALTAAGCAVATSDYGGPFVAAFERGELLACQFHPELSGAVGGALLRRWVQLPQSEEVACSPAA